MPLSTLFLFTPHPPAVPFTPRAPTTRSTLKLPNSHAQPGPLFSALGVYDSSLLDKARGCPERTAHPAGLTQAQHPLSFLCPHLLVNSDVLHPGSEPESPCLSPSHSFGQQSCQSPLLSISPLHVCPHSHYTSQTLCHLSPELASEPLKSFCPSVFFSCCSEKIFVLIKRSLDSIIPLHSGTPHFLPDSLALIPRTIKDLTLSYFSKAIP